MNNHTHGEQPVHITTRDKVMRAWENAMELTRDFELYSKQINDDPETAAIFAKFAEDECVHAAQFREILHKYQEQHRFC